MAEIDRDESVQIPAEKGFAGKILETKVLRESIWFFPGWPNANEGAPNTTTSILAVS
jgi:hypothetical protein